VSNGAGNGAGTSDVAAADLTELGNALLQIVSEKTGYPAEMLEADMDMEADLGIDSIKRVEILGTMQDLYPALPRLTPEELAELRTLGQIRDHVSSLMRQSAAPAQPAAPAAPAMPEIQSTIPRQVATVRPLPDPDFLENSLPEGHICLLTDDGTTLTASLVEALTGRGWKVVVLSFPPSLVVAQTQLPAAVNRVALQNLDEAHLSQTLQSIAATYGPVGAFIHVQPTSQNGQGHAISFSDTEKAIVRHVFLLAKHLKLSLNEAAQQGRSYFVTVARLDGAFGMGHEPDFGAVGGGLFGLTKTLNQEWERVFCRSIDLQASLNPQQAAQYIIAELHDPNHLITEVGYSAQGRATLVGV
jgi:acyl carrier protein